MRLVAELTPTPNLGEVPTGNGSDDGGGRVRGGRIIASAAPGECGPKCDWENAKQDSNKRQLVSHRTTSLLAGVNQRG